jgi:hypothetical protein
MQCREAGKPLGIRIQPFQEKVFDHPNKRIVTAFPDPPSQCLTSSANIGIFQLSLSQSTSLLPLQPKAGARDPSPSYHLPPISWPSTRLVGSTTILRTTWKSTFWKRQARGSCKSTNLSFRKTRSQFIFHPADNRAITGALSGTPSAKFN